VHYHCASGADIIGNPVPGVVVPVDPAAGPTTSVAATTSTTAGTVATLSSTWIAQVAQAGIAARQVAVLTLYT
jgi:hypothetical protein